MFMHTMNFDLGEDVNALREMVHRFAQERIKPMAADIDLKNEFPNELWKEFGDLGLLGVTVPEEYGGAGMSYLAHVIAVEEIARASASVSLSYGAHSNLCVNQIKLNGNDEQKAKYLPRLISGEHVGALAMSEPSAGSDVVSMKLRAEKRNDRFVLNGNKYWITNGPDADTLVVYAKTDPDAGPRGITAFLIEKEMKGFSTSPHFDKLGMRGSNTAELIFEDVRIPAENVLGEVNRGFYSVMKNFQNERIVLGAMACAEAQTALDMTVDYVKQRRAFGGVLWDKQAVRQRLADCQTRIAAGRQLVYHAAGLDAAGGDCVKEVSMVKAYCGELVNSVLYDCVQFHGGMGYMRETPVERMSRDARVQAIGGGASEVMLEEVTKRM